MTIAGVTIWGISAVDDDGGRKCIGGRLNVKDVTHWRSRRKLRRKLRRLRRFDMVDIREIPWLYLLVKGWMKNMTALSS